MIRHWEAANADRLEQSKRDYYEAHREEIIARTRRRKTLETAAVAFLSATGLLPPGSRQTAGARRAAALRYVRGAGLL
jgi:hypothetical protein